MGVGGVWIEHAVVILKFPEKCVGLFIHLFIFFLGGGGSYFYSMSFSFFFSKNNDIKNHYFVKKIY